jgi:hypothetical protein
VEETLRRLEHDLERRGRRVRLRRDAWRPPSRPRALDDSDLRRLAEVVARRPDPRRERDQVPATLATIAKRAAFLAATYDLRGADLVCLGDHDLTSLAVALLCPECRVTAVDVDDRLLEFLDGAATELGVLVRTAFADLRVGLPPGLRGSADLVFSDPPYTPEGIELFAARGLDCLRRDSASRLLLCYGFGERHPALGLKVQDVPHRLHLVLEAVWPRFNRYRGAHAIGAASSLYVCRPTRRTWPAVDAWRTHRTRIYTHGPNSVEAAAAELPVATQAAVARTLAAAGMSKPVLVGEGWPAAELTIGEYLDGGDVGEAAALSLFPDYGHLLVRVALLRRAELLVVVTDRGTLRASRLAAGDPMRRLVEQRSRVHVLDGGRGGRPAVVTFRGLERAPAPPEGVAGLPLHALRRLAEGLERG